LPEPGKAKEGKKASKAAKEAPAATAAAEDRTSVKKAPTAAEKKALDAAAAAKARREASAASNAGAKVAFGDAKAGRVDEEGEEGEYMSDSDEKEMALVGAAAGGGGLSTDEDERIEYLKQKCIESFYRMSAATREYHEYLQMRLNAEASKRARCLSKEALDEMDASISAEMEEERSERAKMGRLEGRKATRGGEGRRVAADEPQKPHASTKKRKGDEEAVEDQSKKPKPQAAVHGKIVPNGNPAAADVVKPPSAKGKDRAHAAADNTTKIGFTKAPPAGMPKPAATAGGKPKPAATPVAQPKPAAAAVGQPKPDASKPGDSRSGDEAESSGASSGEEDDILRKIGGAKAEVQ
jgi:hypothetical protein